MKYKTFTPVYTLFFSLSFLYATESPPTASNEKDHEQLRAMKAVYEKAVSENNLELLKPMIRGDFSFVTFTDSEFDRKRDDFESWKKEWTATRDKLLKGGSYTVELVPERSLILNDTVAVARGDSRNVIKRGDGKEFSFTAKWTAVCIKEDGEWKVWRAHNSLNPFENSLIKDTVQTMLAKTAAVSGIVGLFVGMLISWIFMKKKQSRIIS